MAIKRKLLILFIVILLIVLDLLTKYIFFDLKVWSNNFFITPVLNSGISRGIWGFPIEVIILLTIVFLWFIFYFWWKQKVDDLVFIFLFSGAIWNFVDRLFFGGVRDFINFHFWPVFNLADVYLSIWVLIFLRKILKK